MLVLVNVLLMQFCAGCEASVDSSTAIDCGSLATSAAATTMMDGSVAATPTANVSAAYTGRQRLSGLACAYSEE